MCVLCALPPCVWVCIYVVLCVSSVLSLMSCVLCVLCSVPFNVLERSRCEQWFARSQATSDKCGHRASSLSMRKHGPKALHTIEETTLPTPQNALPVVYCSRHRDLSPYVRTHWCVSMCMSVCARVQACACILVLTHLHNGIRYTPAFYFLQPSCAYTLRQCTIIFSYVASILSPPLTPFSTGT